MRASRDSRSGDDPAEGVDARRAIALCRTWFQEGVGRDTWAQFLAESRIDQVDLIKLAHARFEGRFYPSWTEVAKRLLSFLGARHFTVEKHLSISWNLARPVAEFAAEELRIFAGENRWRLLGKAASHSLADAFTHRLAWSARGIVEFELAHRSPKIAPFVRKEVDTVSGFFRAGVTNETRRVLTSYPVLLRLWSRQVENWRTFICDFLAHARSFSDSELRLRGKHGTVIRDAQAFLSDPHDGGRSVIAVRFCCGTTWYYKPRSGEHERGWFQLLAWLNEEGFSAPFLLPKVICKERHCWMESVPAKSVTSKRAAASYYSRAGALLYLLHLLRGADFHAGNVIACGTQPVMIDCETLLHARTRVPTAVRVSMRSLLRTGMLPLEQEGRGLEEPSALGRLEKGAHCLTMNGRAVSAHGYLGDIEDGFVTMHRFLERNPRTRDTFSRKVSLFMPRIGRRIYHPTARYMEILSHSHAPGTMVDGTYRSLFFQALCRDGASPRSCIAKEVTALEDGDIPLFCGASATSRPPLTGRELRHSLAILRGAV